MDKEYIYRFKIDTNEKFNDLSNDPMDELIKRNIRALLEIGVFTYQGKVVEIDSFSLHDNSKLIELFNKDKKD